jgi:dGTPase
VRPTASGRGAFEIDRDRIIHSETFRDLQYKTQVQGLVGLPESARFRTRLNHVIEVAQLAGALADRLGGDRPLAEAIALAHDLGHPPFGHAGERALARALQDNGAETWNANLHSLAVVDQVEAAFMDFPGLNLTWATREGIARHSTPFDEPESVGEFVQTPQGGLECQIVDAADTLAYLSHDLDDALADEFVDLQDLADLHPDLAALVADAHRRWSRRKYTWPLDEESSLLRRYVVSNLIARAVSDLVRATEDTISTLIIETSDNVRSSRSRTVVYSAEFAQLTQAILAFLIDRYYRSEAVQRSDAFAEQVISALFNWYLDRPEEVPTRFRVGPMPIAIATYIASLNDLTAASRAQKLGLAEASVSPKRQD